MIFRRIKSHVEKENWFAVFLDFVIVVAGILIAFQITTLNAELRDQREYERALERLTDEAQANVTVLDDLISRQRKGIREVEQGFEALRSCQSTAENLRLINNALLGITGTTTIHIQMNALDEMTSSPVLLAQQDRDARKAFALAKFNLDVLKVEANFAESLPFRDRPESSPAIGISDLPLGAGPGATYHGIDVSRRYYRLELSAPVEQACRDDPLLKSFYTWMRFQSGIPAYAAAMRAEMSALIAAAENDLESTP